MTRDFSCRWGCGTLLHYDNGEVVDGSNAKHWCPNFPRKQIPKSLQSFDQQEIEISMMVKHVVSVANRLSKTSIYDIIAKPKDTHQN